MQPQCVTGRAAQRTPEHDRAPETRIGLWVPPDVRFRPLDERGARVVPRMPRKLVDDPSYDSGIAGCRGSLELLASVRPTRSGLLELLQSITDLLCPLRPIIPREIRFQLLGRQL